MRHDISVSLDAVPARTVAGVLEHLACWLQTGRVRSAHQALVLLERVAIDPDAEPCLRQQGARLAEVIEDRLASRLLEVMEMQAGWHPARPATVTAVEIEKIAA